MSGLSDFRLLCMPTRFNFIGLSESTISILHLDDKSLQIYNELQLEQLAVRLYCNRYEFHLNPWLVFS